MYSFSAPLEIWSGESPWYLVYLPAEYWDELRMIGSEKARGFGSIKVKATIGKVAWFTSIFPDTSSKQYILFIKKSVRKETHSEIGDQLDVTVEIV